MKKTILLLAVIILAASCNKSNSKDEQFLPESSGKINSLQVIVSNALWNGEVGEAIRTHFAGPVDGLPQEEPLFNISQMPPEIFSGFVRRHRCFLMVTKADSSRAAIASNPFAKPQKAGFITASTDEELISLINKRAKAMIAAFKETEIKERQRRISKSLLDVKNLKKKLGVSLRLPSAYRIAKETDNFFWLRKNVPNGNTNIIIYEVPLSAIGNDSTVISDIISIRDSISGANVTVSEGGRFITEEAYAPYLFETEIDGKFTFETKGTWEVKNKFLAGPFLNYAVKDVANNRYLILEGFTFAPSSAKRNHQFELEAILRTAKLE